ncbi:MAG: phosphonate metabolism protein/1,5-bisphosphokinase (PRPP-forming) PhnN [Aestuariivirga sp.]|jgi:ribose 1,5-bisphosphokinase|uniref:phosphonate metabolism protein/1,5-bisphosphokinase (PRPP-forming) PhnN n=1 Tax=Aestuariivirga sp. TaxID=2650926 RepID=UPI0038D10542
MMARPGHLVLVVGPSGAGKDSVLNAAKDALKADRSFVFPRRFVTRLNMPAAEDHVSMTEMEFAIAVAEDAFCLWWGAHGNYYGIGQAVEGDIAAGAIVAVNCSRAAIAEACGRFARVSVVEITAPPEVLVARILARGRESAGQAMQRVSRQVPDYPPGMTVVRIVNDGPLDEAVAQFCAFLRSLQNAAADPGGGALDGEHQQEDRDDDGRGLVIVEQL